MHNRFVYNILYYITFIIMMATALYLRSIETIFETPLVYPIAFLMIITNFILTIIYSIKLFKKHTQKASIFFPIICLIFTVIIYIISYLYNEKLIIEYLQYSYYYSFVLFNYILLNIYSILSLNMVKNTKKKR